MRKEHAAPSLLPPLIDANCRQFAKHRTFEGRGPDDGHETLLDQGLARSGEPDNISFYPDLRDKAPIAELLTKSPARTILDRAFRWNQIEHDRGQIAIRNAHNVNKAYPPKPHIDGVPSGRNGLALGSGISNFTALIGVFLTRVDAEFAGNFTVWPGSHARLEAHFRNRGREAMQEGVPTGPDWLHEIKHDGYRLIVKRDGDRVRLFTRRGFDWSYRYPLIVEAALKLREPSFVIDGEAVVFGANGGTADFDRLHSRRHDGEVRLIAFDLLALSGDDVRRNPLHARKGVLKTMLAKCGDAIQLNPHMRGDIGVAMFEHACEMGLEGIVSKHRDRPYRAGRSSNWVKVKNPASPAMARVEEGSW